MAISLLQVPVARPMLRSLNLQKRHLVLFAAVFLLVVAALMIYVMPMTPGVQHLVGNLSIRPTLAPVVVSSHVTQAVTKSGLLGPMGTN